MTQDNRWMINRAGLLNFWYYDEEEFAFSKGRLLLRGTNGSGKSVTMQSFIPLLLDGNKSPERLDPFGSRARKLENYLLGEDDNGKDESIGYLFMEFAKEQSGKHLTIGMGLKAARGKSLDFWGFSLTDGRRIGKDFFLYKDIGDKVPLTQKELKNRVGTGGVVVGTSREYMKMINELLFGYQELEDYDELIKLLIQLRTPKLSKGFKPTLIYEIMNNSLQPLSDDDLRPMTEAIEHMDGIQSRLEVLRVSKKAAQSLKNAYHHYNKIVLAEKSVDYVKAYDELKNLEGDKLSCSKEIARYQDEFTVAEKNISDLKIEHKALEEHKKQLEKHDSFKIKEEINKLEASNKEFTAQSQQKTEILTRKQSENRRIENDIAKAQQEETQHITKITEQLAEMDENAEECKFHEQVFLKDELLGDLKKNYGFTFVHKQLKTYTEKISNAKKTLEEEVRKNGAYDTALAELDKAKAIMQEKKAELDRASLLFAEIKEEFTEKIYTWGKANHELKISSESLIKIARLIHDYGNAVSFDDVTSEVRANYNPFESALNKALTEHRFQKDNKTQELVEKKAEQQAWEAKKDPEPVRDPKIILNRTRLDRENITYLPLYMAIDFQENLNEDTKGKLEEALLDLGILDALIVPPQYKAQVFAMDKDMADKYLFPAPKLLSYNLSEVLKVDKIHLPAITPAYVSEILSSILLEEKEDAVYIDTNGTYGFGSLKGQVTGAYVPRFIGATARKNFKLEMVAKIQRECAELEQEIQAIEKNITAVSSRLEVLKQEFKGIPSKNDLNAALDQVKELKLDFAQSEAQTTRMEEEERKAFAALQLIKAKVHELTSRLELSPNLQVYQDVEKALGEYRDLLGNLETRHIKLLGVVAHLGVLAANKADLEQDIDDILYELGELARKGQEIAKILQNHYASLELTDYALIAKELDACLRGLESIPAQIDIETRRAESGKVNFKTKNTLLEEFERKATRQTAAVAIYETGFNKEYDLGYVSPAQEGFDPYKTAKVMVRELKTEEQTKGREHYANALIEKYHEHKQDMIEYNLKIEYIFETTGDNKAFQELLQAQKRLEIIGKVRGKQVNFYELTGLIDGFIEENEKLLKDEERQLFEDILANNISKKIRAKIYHSEAWVRKMNELMESMNTSSGLSFSLSWKSKKAEVEGQLNTSELVMLLKSDGHLLREEDLNKLSQHFQSKIKEAKRQSEETGKQQTFHNIMKEVLDYRKWFEFQLFFIKTRENKKELTNNAFDKFSGGEKAMAMYVPLFAAVYARYEGARKDCPRIISLDEAFAGVDENNIRDMFRLLNEFNLNFVINSQILWGDYDTVPSLSICELVRPNNADFVTVIRYKWDGKVKELVTNDEVDYGV